MTREELKKHCENQVKECEMWAKWKGKEPSGRIYEEHKLILELLEQEPCEDCISREKVFEMIDTCNSDGLKGIFCSYVDGERFKEYIKEMPSVQPKAEWIPVSERLPEDGTWNLWTNGRLLPSVERYKLDAMDHFYPDGRWFEFEDAVAWMPLPKLYKTESEVEADKQSGDRE